MKIILSLTIIAIIIIYGCSDNKDLSDAYGNFEAVETLISAQTSGELMEFNVEEGQTIDSNIFVGYIDTVQLSLTKKQLIAQKASISSRYKNLAAQLEVLKEQRDVAMVDKNRIEKMFSQKAATQKQLDDINGRISLIDKQMLPVEAQNPTVAGDLKSIDAQIDRINDQIKKSVIINPLRGTVLNKYTERYELVSAGKPLYKIANMDYITLRVYVSGAQLPNVKLDQNVHVLVDKTAKENKEYSGTVTWISDKAEFTPKIIQTKEERVNMVYAVKVRVKNDGSLKIGMPGEVRF